MSGPREMTRTEREDLKKLARERARVAKADAKRRTADLKANFEHQIIQHYDYNRDEVWAEAVAVASAAVKEAQAKVEERCKQLGIPAELAPHLEFGWQGRGPYAVQHMQGDLRRTAYTRIEAMERSAIHEIDRATLEIQTRLVADGLTSASAIEFLGDMPAVDALMPALDILELTEGGDSRSDDGIDF